MTTETVEQQTTQAEQQTAQAQPEATKEQPSNQLPEGIIRRFGELTAKARAAEEEAQRLREQMAALQSQSQTQGDQGQQAYQNLPNVEELARTMASQMVQQQEQQREIAQRVGSIEAEGRKAFGDEFDRSVQNMQMAGIGSPQFLDVLTRVKGASSVVRFLGDPANLEEAYRISQLPPAQMALEMAEIAPKAAKAYAKSVSNAPAPIQTIESNSGGAGDAEPDRKDTAAWMEWRRKNARRK